MIIPKDFHKKMAILGILKEWTGEGDSGTWYGYKTLSKVSKIPVDELKKLMKQLKDCRMVTYQTCWSDDGIIHGKGYFHNEEWSKR